MKTKILFIAGIIMCPGILAYILVCSAFSDPRDLWPPFEMFWIILYLWTAITMLDFMLFSVLKLYDLIKKSNGSRMDSLAGVLGGVGCALFTFAVCFVWYAVNHPTMSAPFVSVEVARFVYISYAIITVLMLIGAVVLKIIAAVKEARE